MQHVNHTPVLDFTHELLWVKPQRSRREFELRSGETTVGRLVWTRGSNSQALAEWGESRYRFGRKGWFSPRITVYTVTAGEEASEPLVTFSPRGGILTVPDGRTFVWKKPERTSTGRRWTGEHVWVDASGTELVRFRPAKHASVEVIIPPETSPKPAVPLLTLLGQYLIALASQDAETASMAGTVAVIASS
jgi:hypothetical protein